MMERRIAVVDDDPMILMHAKDILAEENVRTACMNSGKQLLKYIENNTPDLILLDIRMPELDGFDTFIQLRKFEEHSGRAHVPVIFVTGDEDSGTEEMGLVLGASDYIKKPFNKDVLIRRIEIAIRNNRKIEDLEEEATIDRLTGLINKAKGTDKISKLCKRKNGALMILDLDSFKLVNDLFGHEKGDKILKAFSDIIRKNSRETDTLSRIGGDEFMGFYDDLLDERSVGSLARRLNLQLQEKAEEILGENHDIPLGISIGVVMVPEYGREYNNLFSLADSALYKVKQNGKHGYAIYGAEDAEGGPSEESVESKLDRMVQIIEERNDKSGALLLGKDYFSVVYKYVMRFYRRYGGDAVIILFELEPPSEDYQHSTEAAEAFSSFVEKTLRMSDFMVQNGKQSFMVMLTQCPKSDIEKVIGRIVDYYKDTEYGKEVKVNYVYKYSLAGSKEKQ